jgi:hypothetical protein
MSSSDTCNLSLDLSKTNLILMIGGQILLLVLVIMVVSFGVQPVMSPFINQVAKTTTITNSPK